MALSQLCEDISLKMDSKLFTCSVFIDLAKAFDTVDHGILIAKLANYGIRGVPAELIKSYLGDRCQTTVSNGTKSDPKVVTCGVPQGSILGPLLFSLYINDIPNVSSFHISLFADDACLLLSNSCPQRLEFFVNNELIKVNDWLKVNKLSVNYNKTNYIIFTKRKAKFKFNIKLEGHTIERVTNIKYLGVILNEKLHWAPHIHHIKNKISKSAYLISKLRHYVNLDTLKMVYYSLVYSHLIYCITSWGGAPTTVLQPILVLQRKIIRMMTFS